MSVFLEISIIIALALGVAFVMRILRQPIIVGYIITGLLAGPYGLNIIHNHETIELFSKFGISMLLFIVGLHLSPKVVKEVGKVSLLTGLAQIFITSLIGFFIGRLLGLDKVSAMYVGIAITFSSTIIILKLLSDKGDLNKLYGKIAIGLLLIQDVVATLVLIFTSTFAGNTAHQDITVIILFTLVKAFFLFDVLLFTSTFVLPKIVTFAAKSQETLFLFSLAWGMGLASCFYALGFSVEIGALIGGVTLAATPFAYEMSSRLKPLRDFFIVLFFILLGSQMVLANIASILLPALLLSIFVLIGNPIIVIIITNLLGFNKRTSFFTGFTITQMSEFSLILATLGFQVGHIPQETLSLITFVALITITSSTYIILYSKKIYPIIGKVLAVLELKKNKNSHSVQEEMAEALLFGYHRMGQAFVKSLEKLELPYLVIDFNPQSIKLLKRDNIPYRYGDAEDVEFLEELELKKKSYVISTLPDMETNLFLVKKIRQVNHKAIIIVESENARDAEELYKAGASYVIVPTYLGSEYASKIITTYGLNEEEYKKLQNKHIEYLEKRLY